MRVLPRLQAAAGRGCVAQLALRAIVVSDAVLPIEAFGVERWRRHRLAPNQCSGANQQASLRDAQGYPSVQVQLHLSVAPPPLSEDAYDVCIRFGEPPDARVIARKVAQNQRLLCASPAYLAERGTPRAPADLARHNCISIHHGDEAYGLWRLTSGRRTEAIKVTGSMVTNDGDIAVAWALDGHGILMRAQWDIDKYLQSGRLCRVLTNYATPPADIYAVYPQRHQKARRVTAFVDYLSTSFDSTAKSMAAQLIATL